jgi:hypothetical protein
MIAGDFREDNFDEYYSPEAGTLSRMTKAYSQSQNDQHTFFNFGFQACQ